MQFEKLVIAFVVSVTLTAWSVREHEPGWPHSGPMPDHPVKVKPLSYESIGKGNQSYRPIDPMPWGDVNKRVAPSGSLPGAPPAPPATKSGETPTKP